MAPDVTVLMMGTAPEGTDPVAWVRESRGGRVFYTSLGTPGDFENASFVRLLTNALFWAAGPNDEANGAYGVIDVVTD